MRSFLISNWKIISAALAVGFFLGVLLGGRVLGFGLVADIKAVRETDRGKYKFINPLLLLETDEAHGIRGLEALEKEIQEFINERVRNGDAEVISVYFREPISSHWFAINEDEKYNPASLLKIPTMMAFYKLAENNPEILAKTLIYTGAYDDNRVEYFKSSHTLKPGPYTIDELIKEMLVYSNNNAVRLLRENIDMNLLTDTYKDLGLTVPTKNTVDFMRVSDYSYFFRVLYNATYLDREFSEKALKILSEIDFTKGLRSVLPANLQISQKFGERTISQTTPDGHTVDVMKQLHDCGIVYYPRNPYFICVMTKGQDFEKLASAIQKISEISYNWMANQKPLD